ncbi:MAG: hypothetical protein LBV46_03150 [Bacteroidales bacterium]|jgi:hypothetical protein|nr:hypothetical protein [Bacteroidales bacterium]
MTKPLSIRFKISLLTIISLLFSGVCRAQDTVVNQEKRTHFLEHFNLSVYIQAQFQWGEPAAMLKVGSPNSNPAKSFNRMGIRRGGIQLSYQESFGSVVFHVDASERGVSLKDAYLTLEEPWLKAFSVKAGVFIRPFGNEMIYSSTVRESPETSTLIQTLFPEERDIGASAIFQMPESSKWHFLRAEAAVICGNGIKLESDNRKDFIGRVSAEKRFDAPNSVIQIGGGLSYYTGSVYQGTEDVYTIKRNQYLLNHNAKNLGKYAKREYFGADLQLYILHSVVGNTLLRAECIYGQQPGAKNDSKSPNTVALPTNDVYIRPFLGGYAQWVQDFGKLPLAAVFRFDWYNPNLKLKGENIGLNYSTNGDIAVMTYGVGLLWRATNHLLLQAYYEFNRNEVSSHLIGYEKDIKNDVFTFRLQYKFSLH